MGYIMNCKFSFGVTPSMTMLISAITANNAKDLEDEEEGEPLIEPTTTWQHLMDQNTKHYYYWNTVSNEVTWTIPAVSRPTYYVCKLPVPHFCSCRECLQSYDICNACLCSYNVVSVKLREANA